MKLYDMTWQEIKDLQKDFLLVILPLGSQEQHGHHLPLNTDTVLTESVALALENGMPEQVVLLPAVCFGHSPHHVNFGAISSSYDNIASLIADISESINKLGFPNLLLLNGHGGNRLPMQIAMQEIKNRNYRINIYSVDYWSAGTETILKHRRSEMGGMGHACEFETSLMLYLHPDKVKKDCIMDGGAVKDLPYVSNDMFRGGILNIVENFDEFTENGVYGKPTLASTSSGKIFFDAIIDGLDIMIKKICEPYGIQKNKNINQLEKRHENEK